MIFDLFIRYLVVLLPLVSTMIAFVIFFLIYFKWDEGKRIHELPFFFFFFFFSKSNSFALLPSRTELTILLDQTVLPYCLAHDFCIPTAKNSVVSAQTAVAAL